MKLSEYIEGLQEILKTEGDLDCYYSSDDGGNCYSEVYYNGTVMLKSKDDTGRDVGLYNNSEEEIEEILGCGHVENRDELEKVICVN